MKFSIRDLLLVTVIVAATSAVYAIAGSLVGYPVGEARQREILEMERSERFWDRVRIETLEQELKDAGIPFPKQKAKGDILLDESRMSLECQLPPLPYSTNWILG